MVQGDVVKGGRKKENWGIARIKKISVLFPLWKVFLNNTACQKHAENAKILKLPRVRTLWEIRSTNVSLCAKFCEKLQFRKNSLLVFSAQKLKSLSFRSPSSGEIWGETWPFLFSHFLRLSRTFLLSFGVFQASSLRRLKKKRNSKGGEEGSLLISIVQGLEGSFLNAPTPKKRPGVSK